MRRVARWTIAGSLAAFSTVAPAPAEYNPNSPHVKAPAETAQYGFMIGEWDCTIRSTLPDGTTIENHTVWRARWILGGWAVQDEWTSESGQAPPSWGTNIRSWDPDRGSHLQSGKTDPGCNGCFSRQPLDTPHRRAAAQFGRD